MMPLRYASLVLLVAVLALAGCRDALIDAPLPTDTQLPGDSLAERSIYLKGPTELPVGVTSAYRAESLPDAVRYHWLLTGGDGQVTGTPTDTRARLYDITGEAYGSVRLTVRAIGANDELLGVGSKTVNVTR